MNKYWVICLLGIFCTVFSLDVLGMDDKNLDVGFSAYYVNTQDTFLDVRVSRDTMLVSDRWGKPRMIRLSNNDMSHLEVLASNVDVTKPYIVDQYPWVGMEIERQTKNTDIVVYQLNVSGSLVMYVERYTLSESFPEADKELIDELLKISGKSSISRQCYLDVLSDKQAKAKKIDMKPLVVRKPTYDVRLVFYPPYYGDNACGSYPDDESQCWLMIKITQDSITVLNNEIEVLSPMYKKRSADYYMLEPFTKDIEGKRQTDWSLVSPHLEIRAIDDHDKAQLQDVISRLDGVPPYIQLSKQCASYPFLCRIYVNDELRMYSQGLDASQLPGGLKDLYETIMKQGGRRTSK
jgi:hypothetical protein